MLGLRRPGQAATLSIYSGGGEEGRGEGEPPPMCVCVYSIKMADITLLSTVCRAVLHAIYASFSARFGKKKYG
jgi:hypothetical protein